MKSTNSADHPLDYYLQAPASRFASDVFFWSGCHDKNCGVVKPAIGSENTDIAFGFLQRLASRFCRITKNLGREYDKLRWLRGRKGVGCHISYAYGNRLHGGPIDEVRRGDTNISNEAVQPSQLWKKVLWVPEISSQQLLESTVSARSGWPLNRDTCALAVRHRRLKSGQGHNAACKLTQVRNRIIPSL